MVRHESRRANGRRFGACCALSLALSGVLPDVLPNVFPNTARAELWEFIDADGVAHYTNVPARGPGWHRMQLSGRRSNVPKTPASQRDRSPERYSRYDAHLMEAAQLYQLPVALLRAVLHVESDFDPNVVSVDGAIGLMQLMPFTAQRMGVQDPFDPRQNILGGARFLRILANQWNGDLVKTVASYNAGAAAVERYRGVPPFDETKRYVNRVLERYYAYRAVDPRAIALGTTR